MTDQDRPFTVEKAAPSAPAASRAKAMGLALGALCVLFFAITVVKIGLMG